jgi:hypothetical protein
MATIITPDGVRDSHVVANIAPSGSGQPATLRFDNGVSQLRLRGDAALQERLEAWFGDPVPLVWATEQTVHVKYPLGARLLRKTHPNTIHLNPQVPWSIDVHGGADELDADLPDIDLQEFVVHGGAAEARLTLGTPTATRTIEVASVKSLSLRRPADVPVRIEVSGGITNLTLDNRRWGAVGGGLEDETPGYHTAQFRYRLVVNGGASGVTVEAL